MNDLSSEIFKKYGLVSILCSFLVAFLIWVLAHRTAAPGKEVSVLWGFVKYTKAPVVESKTMVSDFIFEFSADDWVTVEGRGSLLRIPFAEHNLNTPVVTLYQKKENGNWQIVDCETEEDENKTVIVSIATDGFDGRVVLK